LNDPERELRFWRATGKTRQQEARDSANALGCVMLWSAALVMIAVAVALYAC